jgi:hypothetical protein
MIVSGTISITLPRRYLGYSRAIWVVWGILVSQGLYDIMQIIVLPADQDVSWAVVVVDDISDTVLVITVAGGVDGNAEIFSERLNSLKRALTGTILDIRVSFLKGNDC